MMDKIKSNLNYVLCAFLGLFHFVFLSFRYITAFMSYDGEREGEKLCSGYGLMEFELFEGADGRFLVILAAIIQILLLVLAFAMLVVGVMALLKSFGQFDQFPDQIGGFETSKLAGWALLGYGAANVLILLLLIIFGFANTESYGRLRGGVCAGFGIFFTAFFALAGALCPILLPKFVPGINEGGDNGGITLTYRCAKCGARASKTEKFCKACGGSVVSEVVKQYNYVCNKCGKRMRQSDRFCNACGGSVVAVEVKNYEYLCGNCGKKMRKTDRFCNACGGAVVEKEIIPMITLCSKCGVTMNKNDKFCKICGGAAIQKEAASLATAPAAPVAAGNVCPNCGKSVAEGQRFCNGCGTAVQ